MLKETKDILSDSISYLEDINYFKNNCEFTSKCYKVIFGLEVLLLYVDKFKIDVEGKPTYLSRLKALASRIDSTLDSNVLDELKTRRNSLAHDINAVVFMFKDIEGAQKDLDIVIDNIMILLSECKRFSRKAQREVNKNIDKPTRTKIPDIQESNLF